MIYTHLAAALAALAMGFTAGWHTQGWRWGAADAKRLQAEQRDALVRMERADKAAAGFEQKRAAIRVQQQVITREVDRVVEVPLYRDQCFDAAGLQLVAEAAGAASSPGRPASAVPAADPAR